MADEKKQETTKQDGADKTKTDTSAEKTEETKVDSKSEDTGGELAKAFDDDGKKTEEKAQDKSAGPLKVTVPADLVDLVGDAAEYATAAAKAGITQQQLDAFMAVHMDRVKAAAESADREAERISLDWRRDLMSDPKLGGANLKATMQVAERGARAVGGSALAVALAKHLKGEEVIDGPSLVRAFHMVGLSQNEDRLGGTTGANGPKNDDSALSPTERDFKRLHPESMKRIQAEKGAA